MDFSLRRVVLLGLIATALTIGAVLAMRGVAEDRAAEQARLRETAAGAAPIIALIGGYRAEKGALPYTAADLAGRVPEGVVVDDIGALIRFDVGQPPAWLYAVGPGGTGYELSRRTGTSPRLVYVEENGQGQWMVDPGDGADLVPLDLGS